MITVVDNPFHTSPIKCYFAETASKCCCDARTHGLGVENNILPNKNDTPTILGYYNIRRLCRPVIQKAFYLKFLPLAYHASIQW